MKNSVKKLYVVIIDGRTSYCKNVIASNVKDVLKIIKKRIPSGDIVNEIYEMFTEDIKGITDKAVYNFQDGII